MTKTFWRVKKKSTNFLAYELRNAIPELERLTTEEVESYIRDLDVEFIYKEKVKAKPLIRLTLPFAFIVWLLMVMFLPVNYLIIGKWGYQNEFFENWFRSLS